MAAVHRRRHAMKLAELGAQVRAKTPPIAGRPTSSAPGSVPESVPHPPPTTSHGHNPPVQHTPAPPTVPTATAASQLAGYTGTAVAQGVQHPHAQHAPSVAEIMALTPPTTPAQQLAAPVATAVQLGTSPAAQRQFIRAQVQQIWQQAGGTGPVPPKIQIAALPPSKTPTPAISIRGARSQHPQLRVSNDALLHLATGATQEAVKQADHPLVNTENDPRRMFANRSAGKQIASKAGAAKAAAAAQAKAQRQRQQLIARVQQIIGPNAGPDAFALAKADVRYGNKFGVPPSVLFSQQGIESGHGANTVGPPTPYGNAQGDAQFLQSTRDSILAKYGKSADAFGTPKQTAKAEALLLRDAGYAQDPNSAIYSYNHSQAYVNDVLNQAQPYTALDKLDPNALRGAHPAQINTKDSPNYVDPFKTATQGRVDMGVDYTGKGPIRAMGNAVVTQVGAPGWPNGGAGPAGQGVVYQLQDGVHAGKYVYVYEGLTPTVKAGDHVKAGQQIGTFYPGSSIETGWSDANGQALAHDVYSEGDVTQQGTKFAHFLGRVTGNDVPTTGADAAPTGIASGITTAGGGVGITPTAAGTTGSSALERLRKRRNRSRGVSIAPLDLPSFAAQAPFTAQPTAAQDAIAGDTTRATEVQAIMQRAGLL